MPNAERFSSQVVEIMPLIMREFIKREDNDLSRGKISFPQMVTLDYILKKTRVTMTELSKLLSIKLSSTTVLVDRLVRAGLLTRRHDDQDRRIVWVSITPKGKKVVTQILRQKRRSIASIFSGLTDAERARYLTILLKVKSHLVGGGHEK